jgi:hypothetical protein
MSDLTEDVIAMVLASDWLKERDDRMRSEGWVHRDKEIGTTYDVGWFGISDEEDVYDDVWHSHFITTSFRNADDTSYRWGCEYRVNRVNPFIKGEGI